jgi:rhodanese-related sulfurtransferase
MFFGPRVSNMTTSELADELRAGAVVLVDVREPSEFSAGHVPGAISMPLGGLPQSAEKLNRDAKIVVICQSGHRSVRGAKRLMKAGFTDVRNVVGGTTAWTGKLKK